MTTCSAIDPIGCEPGKISLQGLMGDSALEMLKQSRLVDMVQKAVESAAARPTYGDPMSTSRLALSSGPNGAVGAFKVDLVSDVRLPGALVPGQTEATRPRVQLEERLITLYHDLTTYQVAWKIAQRIQQDSAQLMRGQ